MTDTNMPTPEQVAEAVKVLTVCANLTANGSGYGFSMPTGDRIRDALAVLANVRLVAVPLPKPWKYPVLSAEAAEAEAKRRNERKD